MKNLKELSINELVIKYYPGREVYLDLDGTVAKYRIRYLLGIGNQRRVAFCGLNHEFTFSSMASALAKNKLVSSLYNKPLLYKVPAKEEVDAFTTTTKKELSLAKLKYDYKVGDAFYLAYGYSYNVRNAVKRFPILVGPVEKVKIIKKEFTTDYATLIDVELPSKKIVQIKISETDGTHVNFSHFLGLKSEVDFYHYFE